MANPAVFTFPKLDTAAACALQTTAGAGSFLMNGTQLDVPSLSVGVKRVVLSGHSRVVSLTSTGNISGVNFTITGTLNGAAQTETRVGPNNNTVETTKLFDTITAVTVDGAVATNTSVGIGSTGKTNWFKMDGYANPPNLSIQAIATATINYTVNSTDDNVDTTATANINSTAVSAGLTGASTSQTAAVTAIHNAIQAVINSSSGNGALVLTLTQAG